MSRRDLLAVALCLGLSGAATGQDTGAEAPDARRARLPPAGGRRALPVEGPSWSRRSGTSSGAPRSPGRRRARCAACSGRDGGGLAARVQLVDGRSGRVLGVRELSGAGPGCEELGGAVALAIALAIDPSGATRPRPTPPPMPSPATASPPPAAAPAPMSPSSALAGTAASAQGAGAAGVSGRRGPDLRRGLALRPTPGRCPRSASSRWRSRRRPTRAGCPLLRTRAPRPGSMRAPTRRMPARRRSTQASVHRTPVLHRPTPGLRASRTRGSRSGPTPAWKRPATEAGVPVLVAEPAPPRTGWRPIVGVEALGAAGVLPGFAGGVLVHAGAASSTASVELEGRWLPGTTQAFGTGSVSTSLVSGAVVGCARFGSWSACGLALAGPVSGKGAGFTESQDASAWMVSDRGPGTVGVAVR